MEDFADDMAIELFLVHFFGRAFSGFLGMLPILMLLVLCVIYVPIIIDMLRSAYNPDHPSV